MSNNRVAVITGGGGGIGKGIGEVLASSGIKIALIDADGYLLEETQKEFDKFNYEVRTYSLSVTDEEAIQDVVKDLTDYFGQVDILINNAGITRDTLLMRMKKEDWESVLSVNLTGAYLCSKAFLRLLMRSPSGRIVNISSVVGLMGNLGQVNYSASKAGLIGLTKSSAKELAPRGITVNAIAPGFIESEMTQKLADQVKETYLNVIPLNFFGLPEDVANAVSFLVSEEARYITGEVIRVDGGMRM